MIPTNATYRVSGTILGVKGGTVWDPACDIGLLRPSIKPNVLVTRFEQVPAGSYEFKISVNGSWGTSFGLDGRSDPGCPNITITVEAESSVNVFFDAVSHRSDIEIIVAKTGLQSNRPSPSKVLSEELRSDLEVARRVREECMSEAAARESAVSSSLVRQMSNEAAMAARQRMAVRKARIEEKVKVEADRIWDAARTQAERAVALRQTPGNGSLMDISLGSVTDVVDEPPSPSAALTREEAVVTKQVTMTNNKPAAVIAAEPQKQQPGGCAYIMESIKTFMRPLCGESLCGADQPITTGTKA